MRYKAHQEILRRRGPVLKQAAERFLKAPSSATNLSSLIYLAAAHGDDASLKRIRKLAVSGEPASELAIRVMAEFPSKFEPLEVKSILAKATSPGVRHALLEYLHAVPDAKLAGIHRSSRRRSRCLCRQSRPVAGPPGIGCRTDSLGLG